MSEKPIKVHSAKEREIILIALYKSTFPMVAKFVSKRGGSFEQAKDVFHDALVVWYEKFDGSNPMACSDKAYLFGISKHLWYRKFAGGNQTVSLDAQPETEFEEKVDEQFSSGRLITLLESTGKRCLEMLKSFYYDKLSMTELASGFGFSSVHSATVQKYKCLEKVRKTVKEKSLQYEDFFE
jgi:DNA-directed RNA polymerase specialized sigma24 family protein